MYLLDILILQYVLYETLFVPRSEKDPHEGGCRAAAACGGRARADPTNGVRRRAAGMNRVFSLPPCATLQIAETASLGDAILGALHHQRRRLDSALQNREHLNENLAHSSSLTQRMTQRLKWKHFSWLSLILLLVVAIVTAIWWKMSTTSNDGS